MIIIIDYGMGNLGSILNMYKYLDVEAKISSDLDEIRKASKIILPGVGSFDAAMERLKQNGIDDILNRVVFEGNTPLMGICLGMQLLTKRSDEGNLNGLGWIDAETVSFPQSSEFKVPHVGWNVSNPNSDNKIISNLYENPRYYFVHSYYVQTKKEENSLMKAKYGITFDSAIVKDNIFGFQFHPEKSHKFGMQILKNFSECNV